jgi:phosphatidate cytidylyltransferase
MKQRIITGTLIALVLSVLVYFGEGELEFLFSGFCVLLSGLASFEFSRMSSHNADKKRFNYIAVPLTIGFSTVSVIFFDSVDLYKYIFVFILFALLLYTIIFVSVKDFTRADFGNQLLTIFYTSLGFIAFAFLRKESLLLIVYLFMVSMLTDVFAYFVGIKFGKHRLAINISPKKSVEGAIGGLIIGGVAATLFAFYFNIFDFSFALILVLSLLLSCISQIGDLIASKFKREVGIKDYSNLLPGHGGILDRFDSSMFAAIFLMLAVILI